MLLFGLFFFVRRGYFPLIYGLTGFSMLMLVKYVEEHIILSNFHNRSRNFHAYFSGRFPRFVCYQSYSSFEVRINKFVDCSKSLCSKCLKVQTWFVKYKKVADSGDPIRSKIDRSSNFFNSFCFCFYMEYECVRYYISKINCACFIS